MFTVDSDVLLFLFLFLFFARARQKLPKVNKELALKLMEEGDDEADLALRKKKGKVRKSSGSLRSRPNLLISWNITLKLCFVLFFFPPPHLQALPSILGDDRFKMMFENPDYQVDEQSEEFRLLNPIVSKVEQKRKKKLRLLAQQAAAAQQVTL